MYDYLIGNNRKTGAEEPTNLASSWTVAADGREWAFTLKENVPFYDVGRPSERHFFRGEDVKHTWLLQSGQLSDKAFNAYSTGPLLGGVTDVVVDGNTVGWVLDDANPELSEYLSEDWTLGIISKQYWDDVGGETGYEEAPIGTGAFSFVFQGIGSGLLLERNSDHYRHEPHFAELEFIWVDQFSTRTAMLIAGEVHIGEIPIVEFSYKDILKEQELEIARSTLPSFQILAVMPWYLPEALDGTPTPNYDESAPLRNEKVREALNLAIDRNEINEVFYGGQAMPSAVPHFVEWWTFFKDEWAPIPGPTGATGSDGGWPYPYEPELAKSLLAEAGYSNEHVIDLLVPFDLPGMPEIAEIGEVLASKWGEVGVHIDFHSVEYSNIQRRLAARDLSGSAFITRLSRFPLSGSMDSFWRYSDSPYYEYPLISDWKRNYDETVDSVERERLAHILGDFFRSEHLGVPLVWIFGEAGYNPDVVEGYEVDHKTLGPVRYHEYTLPASGET